MIALNASTLDEYLAVVGYDRHLNFKSEDSCWLWTGSVTSAGYGVASSLFGGTTSGAHRLAWELTHGLIPSGLIVCHHCDNPPCVRPDHLFLGTHLDNSNDMRSKGRCSSVLIGRRERLTTEEFWQKVNKTASCWLWTGPLAVKGWGWVDLHTANQGTGSRNSGRTAHHHAWALAGNPPVPSRRVLAQKCGNKLCVNVEHMFVEDWPKL